MVNQLTSNEEVLRLFFSEPIFLTPGEAPTLLQKDTTQEDPAEANSSATELTSSELTFNYLGQNRNHILILVNDSQEQVSNEPGRLLLRNMLKALKWTADDFALLNYASYQQVQYAQLYGFFHCRTLLAFGVGHEELGLENQVFYEWGKVNQSQILYAENLSALHLKEDAKKRLWNSLKQLLDVK